MLNDIKILNKFLNSYKKIKLVVQTPLIFSIKEMIITKKKYLNENQLKYNYQKQLIPDLDHKHKEWSKFVSVSLKPFINYI